MQYLKIVLQNFIIWIIGIVLCGAWMMWDLERNPVPPNPGGSIPDSLMIPLMGFAFLLAIVLVVANLTAWIYGRFKLRPFQ